MFSKSLQSILVGLCLLPTLSLASDIYPFVDINGYIVATAGQVISEEGSVQTAFQAKEPTDYLFYDDSGTSFYPDTNAGLQADITFSSNFSSTVQVSARGTNKLEPELSMLFGDYRIDSSWNIQLGRKNTPTFYYSGYENVSSAYVWVTTPLLIYGDALSTTDGAFVYYRTPVVDDLLLTLNLWGGRRHGYSPMAFTDAKDEDAIGFRTTLEGDVWSLNAYYLQGALEVGEVFNSAYYLLGWSAAYEGEHWQIITEQTFAFYEHDINDYTQFMFSAAYRLGALSPYFMLSVIKDTNDRIDQLIGEPAQSELQQYSLGVRWDIDSHIALKGELTRTLNYSDTSDTIGGASFGFWNALSSKDESINGLLVPAHTTLARISLSYSF